MSDLKPGPELAACVAVEVMGWPRTQSTEEDWGKRPFVAEFTDREGGSFNVYAVGNNNWRPDRDIAAAWEVHKVMQERPLRIKQRYWRELETAIRERTGAYVSWPVLFGVVEPVDFCLAALAATKPTATD